MAAPNLIWDRARDVWGTESISLLSEHSDVFSETWPTSGSMRSGLAFERPTLVPRMAASVSSFLPTPDAYSDRGGSQPPEKRRAGGHQPSLQDVIEHL